MSAGLITRDLFCDRDIKALASPSVKFWHLGGLDLYFKISLVTTLMYVSRVGDLPLGGVHPVELANGSGFCCSVSLNQCFNLSLLLNSNVSLCMSMLSAFGG